MPELPEVEVTCRGIAKVLLDARIERIDFDDKQLREPYAPDLMSIAGGRIQEVSRRSKYIIIRTAAHGSLILHLGMTGHLRIDREAVFRPHDHFMISLDNGYKVVLNDIRRFGLVLYADKNTDPRTDRHLVNLGVEPFSEDFSAAYLHEKFKHKRKNVKQVLMDGRTVVGIGNIYACEILFACGIAPGRMACSISEEECALLVRYTRSILQQSIEQGGTTIRDFEGAEGQKGYFVRSLKVYGQAGAGCPKCGTRIKKVVLGQRSTFYCPNCQRLGQDIKGTTSAGRKLRQSP